MPRITLKAARVNANLSQSEAAEKLNIATSTLRRWEKGKTFPKQNQIVQLCNLYNVDFNHIFFGTESTLS